MPERFRRRRWHRLDEQASHTGSSPNSSTDNLDSARATMSSNELVRSMYEEAQKKAEGLEAMAQVAVTLTKRGVVNHAEILTSLTTPGLTEQYGVEFTMQADNTFYFQKV
ncbi:MAG TPA: hypothetical protein VFH06_01695 [Candidatus Saccharimonadales bacterium]|nr:hypothetical protein [Candidatus Saccharimonadales bacterium]